MGKALLERMLPALGRVQWSDNDLLSDVGRLAYDDGLEKVENAWNNQPDLINALRVFATCDSAPYAFAGVAYTLIAAARESDGSYDPAGIEAAMKWLERAQAMAPDALEINFIEPLVYIHSGRFDDARTVLDYLLEYDSHFYYLRLVDIAYWDAVGDADSTKKAYERAIAAAENVPQRLRLQERQADSMVRLGLHKEAIEMYRKALPFDSENAMLWTKLGAAYLASDMLDEAEQATNRALQIKKLPEAVEQQNEINNQRGGTLGLGRLFRR